MNVCELGVFEKEIPKIEGLELNTLKRSPQFILSKIKVKI